MKQAGPILSGLLYNKRLGRRDNVSKPATLLLPRPLCGNVEKETLISANSLLEHKVLYLYPALGYINDRHFFNFYNCLI